MHTLHLAVVVLHHLVKKEKKKGKESGTVVELYFFK
jgi:phage-related protein